MAEEIESADGAARWKQKYYAGLEQLEAKEKQWGDVESLLRRCISRLSLVADGADATLDGQIESLRNALRDGRDSLGLRGIIDTIGDTVVRLDRRKAAQKAAPVAAPREVLAQLLDALTLPRGMGRKVKALRKRLTGGPAGADFAPLLQEFSALLHEALALPPQDIPAPDARPAQTAQADDPAQDVKRGMFGKLFGARAAPKDESATQETHPVPAAQAQSPAPAGEWLIRLLDHLAVPLEAQDRLNTLKRRAQQPAQHALHALIDDIARLITECINEYPSAPAPPAQKFTALHEALLQLLERLDLPIDMDADTEALKQRLEEGVTENELAPLLERIADLVAGVRSRMQRERIEIENFLQQLTTRLSELDAHLQGAEAARHQAAHSGREWSATLQGHVQGINSAMQHATDLNQLKHAVQERVDAIALHVEEQRRKEDARNAQAEQQMRQLATRLQAMEQETGELRTRVTHARSQAVLDALTGVPNRLAYKERLEQEYARWRRYQSPLTLLVWDVDRFKYINDNYGHKSGDKALITIAHLLRDQIRETDFLARYGGEEFVMLMPATQLIDAQAVAEKLRASVETCNFHFRETIVPITISCGIAEFSANDTPENVFERADTAMYRAKKVGGNRCLMEEEAAHK